MNSTSQDSSGIRPVTVRNSIMSRREELSRLSPVQMKLLETLIDFIEKDTEFPKFLSPDSELGQLIVRNLLAVIGFPDEMSLETGSDYKADYFLTISQAWVSDCKAVFIALSICLTRIEFVTGLDLSILQEKFGFIRHLDLYSKPMDPRPTEMNINVNVGGKGHKPS